MPSEGMGQRTDAATSGDGLKERTIETVAEVDAAAMHVADVAGDEAGHVAHEAERAARGFFDETRMQVTEQASTQQHRAAEALRTAGDELSEMAGAAPADGMAVGLVRGLGRQTRTAASWLEQREPADLVQEVRGFARRHTGAFLVAAVGLGIVAGRLTRALMAERGGGGGTNVAGGGSGGGYGAATAATGQGMPTTGVGADVPGERVPGAGVRSGDTPIADSLAGEPAVPGAGMPATAVPPGTGGPDDTGQDEWSPSGEERR
ncbi:hypothetical protein [Microbacterium cremeum]|uniref:hypothetical protein n=1 Tax=Microbacterium cremeum TaxID=2782169 RepID=UPI001889581B|nr:hypothetical protein [Microbacterium cremeum]